MPKFFGTDGVRGVANRDLSPLLAFRLGRAAGALLAEQAQEGSGPRRRPVVLVGRDTRVSGGMLEGAITAGLTSTGADVIRLGVIPTPGLSYLTHRAGVDAGVMISASHNPVEDNGIKFFAPTGYKLPDEQERRLEAMVLEMATEDRLPSPTGAGVGRVTDEPALKSRYQEFLTASPGVRLEGLRVVVDCANGAAGELAPAVFRALGAEVVPIFTGRSGEDVNVNCGSTHPQALARAVREHGADAGLAFDGDADRCIAVDEQGQVVDGDQILAIFALERLRSGSLPNNAVACTVYSNGGLAAALGREGGRVVVTPPGDRHVLEALLEHGLVLGGEQSGHIILLEHARTGDGILTGAMLLSVMKRRGLPLSRLAGQMPRMPQVLVNVRVRDRERVLSHPSVTAAIEQARASVGEGGRVYVRASGTEPVVRVMVEGADEARVQRWAHRLAQALQAAEAGESGPTYGMAGGLAEVAKGG